MSQSQMKSKDSLLKKYLNYELLETLQKYDASFLKCANPESKKPVSAEGAPCPNKSRGTKNNGSELGKISHSSQAPADSA